MKFVLCGSARYRLAVVFLLLVCLGAGTEPPPQQQDDQKPSSSSSSSSSPSPQQSCCGVYLAKSTIANAGWGMFAGNRNYSKGDMVLDGDIVVPLMELLWNNNHNPNLTKYFLWFEYEWSPISFPGMEDEVEGVAGHPHLHAASFGVGAALNAGRKGVGGPWEINVRVGRTDMDNEGLHRRKNPGVGAFTPYHNRKGFAQRDIVPGQELLIDYGSQYFEFRERTRGMTYGNSNNEKITDNRNHSSFENHTRSSAKNNDNDSIRSMEWLERHGKCVDSIRPGRSNILEAGRGAFAARFIAKDSLVAPAPLIHIPDSSIFTMYQGMEVPHPQDKSVQVLVRNVSAPIHQQLLLNYCFGHRNSTILLSPYGSFVNLINHGGKRHANARIVWAEDAFLPHPEWKHQSIDAFGRKGHAGLAFDIVALRDIAEGEEILMDYGDEWQEAWEEHVGTWSPPEGAAKYIPAFELNNNLDHSLLLRTVHEASYPENVRLFVHPEYLVMSGLVLDRTMMPVRLNAFILDRYTYNGETLYRALLYETRNFYEWELTAIRHRGILFGAPRDAFAFEDLPWTRDHALPTSFRHEIMIPNDVFPDAWKNR